MDVEIWARRRSPTWWTSRSASTAHPPSLHDSHVFLAFQRDPATGFVQVQKNLARDRMNEYMAHTSSAVFACPPGAREAGDWWGRALFS